MLILSLIHSVTGLSTTGAKVQLRNNQVTELCQDDWKDLLDMFDIIDALDLRGKELCFVLEWFVWCMSINNLLELLYYCK